MPKTPATALVTTTPKDDAVTFVQRALSNVREELLDNTYIQEAVRVLPVGGYRSAIGNLWNAVVDDLRRKIIHRSLEAFNKAITISREIKTYEDFQNHVTDDALIDGAYKIGVIGWEAHKVLKHAKETRHIFDGHPDSTEPSIFKVLSMIDDCTKYVLKEEYPPQLIDIDDYLATLGSGDFDRNNVAIETGFGDLPESYKNELVNRLFTAYIHPDSNSVLRSNIEFVAPILWTILPKTVKVQVVRRVDQEITKAVASQTDRAFDFVKVVMGQRYLSIVARRYKTLPLIETLEANLDNWEVENQSARDLAPYAALVPPDALNKYVSAITHTYVGHIGHSFQYSRTNFFANQAAVYIPGMFSKFDDAAASEFVNVVKTSKTLRERIRNPAKLARLRALGNIVLEKVSESFDGRDFLEALADEEGEEVFLALLKIS